MLQELKAELQTTTPQGMTYRQQVSAKNVLSYSTLLQLHSCPRRMMLEKATAGETKEEVDNPDFLYGHAVGAGIQSYIAFGDRDRAILDCFLAWNGDLETTKQKSKKSVWFAILAIDKFIQIHPTLLAGWEVAVFQGKPAVELAFKLDLDNGYYYLGHIDLILYNPAKKTYMILELKTTSFTSVNEATYKNSAQALGYSLILDALVEKSGEDATASYTVLYLVFKSGSQEYEALPFLKTRSQRAAFLMELAMDCTVLDFYATQDYYPARGESCYSFFRECEFFGICGLKSGTDKFKTLRILNVTDTVAGIDVNLHVNELDRGK
jgi:hypothetical protein